MQSIFARILGVNAARHRNEPTDVLFSLWRSHTDNALYLQNLADQRTESDNDRLITQIRASQNAVLAIESELRRRTIEPPVNEEAGHGAGASLRSVAFDCALSSNGDTLVAAMVEKYLSVWDSPRRFRVNLIGHTGVVYCCAVSADTNMVVSGSGDRTIRLWNARTGAENRTLIGHDDAVLGCALSPDGRLIVSASADQTLKVWDARTGTERVTARGHTDRIWGCAIRRDGRLMVSASADQTLKVWDTRTGKQQATLRGHTDCVNGCVLSSDGTLIVSASADHTLKLWTLDKPSARATLTGHAAPVRDCALNADSTRMCSLSADNTLKIWDMATLACLATVAIDGVFLKCAWHPAQDQIVLAGDTGLRWVNLKEQPCP
ncbi:MAG TPA: WD40 repeat domain-containing protein [Herpetosiphonaceae bacterium]|nr:WD40 repeat domain-containing protein [Herpetosiphonaceae bacterium]